MDNVISEFKSIDRGSEIRVRFTPAVLHDLKREVIRGYKSIPRRGAEIGGLLRGAILLDSGKIHVRITGIVPVAIEYRFGPSWHLSERDEENLRKAIDAANTETAKGEVIGWYRSHTRSGNPVEEDRLYTARLFPAGISAFLTCYPDADLNVAATLMAWTAGADERQLSFNPGRFSLLEDALQSVFQPGDSDEVEEEPVRAVRSLLPQLPEPLPDETAVTSAAGNTFPGNAFPGNAFPGNTAAANTAAGNTTAANNTPWNNAQWTVSVTPPARRSPYLRGALIAVLTLAIIGVVGLFLRNHLESRNEGAAAASTNVVRPPAAQPAVAPPTGLGMKVERQGKNLLVSWNRDAPQIQQAVEGSFTIGEGKHTRVLQLSLRELYTGGLLYTSSGEDVRMELDVRGPSGDFGQSIRVVGSDWHTEAPPKAPPITFKVPAPPPQSKAAPESKSPAESKASAEPVPESKSQWESREPAESRTVAEAVSAPPVFVPAPTRKPLPKQPLTVSDVPDLQASLRTDSPVLLKIPALPTDGPGPSDRPNNNGPTHNESVTARPIVSAFVPARAIQSFQPSMRRDGLTVSPSAFSQSDTPQEIIVDVTIDVHGNVTKASVNKSKGAAANLLAQSALDAAWKWRFTPATQGGKPVESHMDLKFVFSGNKR